MLLLMMTQLSASDGLVYGRGTYQLSRGAESANWKTQKQATYLDAKHILR